MIIYIYQLNSYLTQQSGESVYKKHIDLALGLDAVHTVITSNNVS